MSHWLAVVLLGWLGGSIYFYLEGVYWSPNPRYSHQSLMFTCMLWPVFGLCQLLCWLIILLITHHRRPKPATFY